MTKVWELFSNSRTDITKGILFMQIILSGIVCGWNECNFYLAYTRFVEGHVHYLAQITLEKKTCLLF